MTEAERKSSSQNSEVWYNVDPEHANKLDGREKDPNLWMDYVANPSLREYSKTESGIRELHSKLGAEELSARVERNKDKMKALRENYKKTKEEWNSDVELLANDIGSVSLLVTVASTIGTVLAIGAAAPVVTVGAAALAVGSACVAAFSHFSTMHEKRGASKDLSMQIADSRLSGTTQMKEEFRQLNKENKVFKDMLKSRENNGFKERSYPKSKRKR